MDGPGALEFVEQGGGFFGGCGGQWGADQDAAGAISLNLPAILCYYLGIRGTVWKKSVDRETT